MAAALNALGVGLCLAGIGLLLVRHRIVARETDAGRNESRLEDFFLGPYWLDLGIGLLVIGFVCQMFAWFFWGV